MVIEEQPAWAQKSELSPLLASITLLSFPLVFMGGCGRGSGRGSACGLSAWTAFLNTLLTSNLGTEAVLIKNIYMAAWAAGRELEVLGTSTRPGTRFIPDLYFCSCIFRFYFTL